MLLPLESTASGLQLRDIFPSEWNCKCEISYNRDSWVKLYNSPNRYADEEALLLCEKSPGIWVSWIPSHGEKVLHKSEFYC